MGTSRRPTGKQVDLLRAVSLAQATAHDSVTGRRTYRADLGYGQAPVTADVSKLIANGWVESEQADACAAPAILRLTYEGEQALRDAGDRAECDAIPLGKRPRVSVTPRKLGGSPIRGMRGPAPGRNVQCWDCYRVQRDAGSNHPSPTVWYTNESGTDAQRAAETALIRHTLAHVRGEIPAPKD